MKLNARTFFATAVLAATIVFSACPAETTKETAVSSIPDEWKNLRIYQVMVSAFQDGDPSIGYEQAYGPWDQTTGGDLRGIINALPYIKSLGMNAIWMTPIFDSAGKNDEKLNSTGYYAYDYFNVDPHFGTKDDLTELVEKAHSRGIYVILDGVFGHWSQGGIKKSPSGNLPKRSHGQYKGCDYPESLAFFNEVAAYWIKNFNIDGWRLDQCYQVGLGEHANGDGDNCYTGGHNYWYEIRKTVEEAAASNGTLGYMVGEHWNGNAAIIQKGSVNPGSADGYGLRSCFDFPARYKIVQSLAKEEGTNTGTTSLDEAVSYCLSSASTKGYSHPDGGYIPNLFITNHDLFRFGNLVNRKFGDDNTTDRYFGLHRAAIAILAVYSGPITLYYGDEWGAYTAGYNKEGDLGAYNDNSSRTSGKVDNFTKNERSLVEYTSKLMNVRSQYPAMWKGNLVTEKSTSDYFIGKKVLKNERSVGFIINKSANTVKYNFKGTDLLTGQTTDGSCPPYSAEFVLLD
ncbi:alpha-amylase family protein [uncultured Treponema sp.]|uniref:alpha-amylase family protein n=1 Tax=uncultured Treponema sp. TaxID=162155 RepID=UPI00259883E9|nr:alpha-amylase family protein [uncultured Treponema sp.]